MHTFSVQKLPRLSRPKSAPNKGRRKKRFQRRGIGGSARFEVEEMHFKTSKDIEKERRHLIANAFQNPKTCSDKVQNVQQTYNARNIDWERDNSIFQKGDMCNFTIIKTSSKSTPQHNITTAIHARHDGARERAFLIEARRNKLLG